MSALPFSPSLLSTLTTTTCSEPITSTSRLVYSQAHPTQKDVYSLMLNRPREHNALSREMLLQMEQVIEELAASMCVPQVGRRPSLFDTPPWASPISTSRRGSRSISPTAQPQQQKNQRQPNVDHQPTQTTPNASPLTIRALIIQSSAPGKFCAGADLKERKTMSEEEVVDFLGTLRRVFDKIAAFPAPTIAALDGPTLGGGLELAVACDFRVANRTVTRIGFPESSLGIIPGAGGTQRAPRLLGLTKAKELIYTGRSLNAVQAVEWGLVDYLTDEQPSQEDHSSQDDDGTGAKDSPPLPAAQTAPERSLLLASTMSNSAPLALRAAKISISRGAEMELTDALNLEVQCYEDLLPTLDRREALEAFAEKRKPNFVGA